MRHKFKALNYFKQYKHYADTRTNRSLRKLHVPEHCGRMSNSFTDETKLKVLLSNNSGEYLCKNFKQHLIEHCIQHQLTVKYIYQKNRVAERMKCTIFDLEHSMIHHKGIEKRCWAETMTTAAYLVNCVSTRALPANTTPFLYGMEKISNYWWYVLPSSNL